MKFLVSLSVLLVSVPALAHHYYGCHRYKIWHYRYSQSCFVVAKRADPPKLIVINVPKVIIPINYIEQDQARIAAIKKELLKRAFEQQETNK
jgi:hypothetical protein